MKTLYNHLQLREIFHLEFLRRLGAKTDPKTFALKGGVNLRLFFRSARYSEDLDLDVKGLDVDRLKDLVFAVLKSPSFLDSLEPFGIDKIRLPDPLRAKQTETTQRFKVHIETAGIDLFSKIEFSRRGIKGTVVVEAVPESFLRLYRIPPLWAPHYDLHSTISQKIEALALRRTAQARDIFDLFILAAQLDLNGPKAKLPSRPLRQKALERLFEIGFTQFRDTVLSYLSPEDRNPYDRSAAWDDIKLRVSEYLEMK